MSSQFTDVSTRVLDLGKPGIAAAEVLMSLGAQVIYYDTFGAVLERAHQTLGASGAAFCSLVGEESQAQATVETGHKLLIVSPKIPPHNPLYRLSAVAAPVWPEVELAWQVQREGPNRGYKWLCITGIDGRATTTGVLVQMLITGGVAVTAARNYGTPIIQVVAEGAVNALAVELSSFRLRATFSARP